MCILVERVDLGPADALLDLTEGVLVLRPTLTRPEQVAAARKALRAGGVRQAVTGVTCRCGSLLTLPPSPLPPTPFRVRASRAVSLVAAGLVAILGAFVSLPQAATATDDPYDTHRWRETERAMLDDCRYDGALATCSSRWGPVTVSAGRYDDWAEYRFAGGTGRATVHVFSNAETRDDYVRHVNTDAIPVGERSAYWGPPEVGQVLAR